MKFLDTNIILRFLTRDDEAKAESCYQLFQRVQQGEEEIFTSEAIIAEVAYVLYSRRAPYQLSHSEIRDRLLPILTLQGLKLPQKRVCLDALDIYADSPFLDFEDALTVAHMGQRGINEIVSYDRDFDRVAGIQRVEP
jgi:predicted nucleic acid-binding protein